MIMDDMCRADWSPVYLLMSNAAIDSVIDGLKYKWYNWNLVYVVH